MTDKERMDVVERCHSKMKRYRNLVSYYTNKNSAPSPAMPFATPAMSPHSGIICS